jgi:lipopolysaccharide/colanic/teichoic acid biosynthesis glycosyltransferase
VAFLAPSTQSRLSILCAPYEGSGLEGESLLDGDTQTDASVIDNASAWKLEPRNPDEHGVEVFPTRVRWQVIVKRCLDVLGAAIGLLLLSPLFLLIAVLVKLHDRGPILYRRHVLGISGSFDAFKFRSMRIDADTMLHNDSTLRQRFEQDFKLKDDPRITRIGAVLRRHSLDELPQLVNVLLGQMSLVGPRMITAPELKKYGDDRRLLLSVKPGLTGYWQVCGRQNVGYQKRVEMDVYYIRHWSLNLDLKILLLTPWKVLQGDGAF